MLLFAAPRRCREADVFQLMSAVVIDVGARLVRREGIDIRLAPKAFDLLLILVRISRTPSRTSACTRRYGQVFMFRKPVLPR